MATLTRLASTLTAKFSPSQTLTDAFYIDGRLCGKRETRQADITIEKEERGYFFSVFTHPTIEGFEPGMLPPFEPQFRSLCNDVKFGHKEIDSLIEKFLSTAVDVTGKMRLSDNEMRSPYFSGIIVKDAEAFAVTIGNGLAFLYRDDTLFPLTDAGIPMEAIDAFDNRVGDFMYYCASKTANALWSNYFTLSPDDCISLCNKAVYDALGQRELLRILNEAEDQCDAAGVVITQASARMPNVPMQFSISFVENVTNTDKRGIFGFKKKSKEDNEEENNVESVVEGGVVGAAAEAVSDAGFVSLSKAESAGEFITKETAGAAGGLLFGAGAAESLSIPVVNQPASTDNGIEVSSEINIPDEQIEFLDSSVPEKAKEVQITPEQLFKSSLDNTKDQPKEEVKTAPMEESETKMETISVSAFTPETSTDDEPTKPITNLDASVFSGLKEGGILAQAIKSSTAGTAAEATETAPGILEEIKIDETPVVVAGAAADAAPEAPAETPVEIPVEVPVEAPVETPVEIKEETVPPEIINKPEEIVFEAEDEGNKFFDVPTEESFNPYSAGDPEEMKNAAPLVFGDDGSAAQEVPVETEVNEEVSEIPVPEFEIDSPKPEITEEDKLNVDFPETVKEEPVVQEEVKEEFKLPFANDVETVGNPEPVEAVPAMPEYDANVFDTPVNAINSEEPITADTPDTYAYGEYEEAAAAAPAEGDMFTAGAVAPQEEPPYQPFGGEVFATKDQARYEVNDAQQVQSGAYAYDPAQETAAQPVSSSSSSAGSADDAWIMDLLGVDDDYTRDEIPDAGNFVAGGAAQAPNNSRGDSYNSGSAGPNGGRPQQGIPSGGHPSGGGRGNGGKRNFHLNRNGYIFIAFVVLLLICLIIMISLILKSCNNKKTSESSASSSNGDAVIINPTGDASDASGDTQNTGSTEPGTSDQSSATETTANQDPSAPIASFQFSDYVGFRTWWDLFNYVYNIQLSNFNDPRIQKIREYNRLPDDYTPGSGDTILLPPPGVLDGSIPITFIPGETQAAGGESQQTTQSQQDSTANGNIRTN